jgi:hypothetical protein
VGDSQSRAQASTKIYQSPKPAYSQKLICWLLWVISKYYCAFFGYIDILPLRLCLIDIVCFDNAGILLCLLWPLSILYLSSYLPLGLLCLLGCFCLLGYFASWDALPLGLLCLLGCFASWVATWAILPFRLYIDTLPLRLCLIGIVCFDNAGILICLSGCAIAGHLLVCKNDKTS